MKKLFYLLCLSFLIFSCNSENIDDYSESVSIKFTVTSPDMHRLSKIETSISNGVDDTGSTSLHIIDMSYSDQHLPYVKEYLNQNVYRGTQLGIHYKDNSGGIIGEPFIPYTVTLKIYVNGTIMSKEEVTITTSGFVINVDYMFPLAD